MNYSYEEKWLEDIEFLKNTLINKHKNAFFKTNEKEFYQKIDDLKADISKLHYNDIKVELSKIVASIGDAHTDLAYPNEFYIPMEFYYFQEGIYVVNTIKKYRDTLNKKLVAINDIPIEEVVEDLREMISHENYFFFKRQVVNCLRCTDILYGALIIDDYRSCRLTLQDGNKKIDYEILSMKDKEIIYEENKIKPLYSTRCSENYWFSKLDERDTLYIKYNSCREFGDTTIEEKIKETIEFIENNNVRKIILDLRNNLGGNSTLLDPLIEYIRNHKDINQKGNLYLIIGKDTFSSALLNAYSVKNSTKAIIVGEGSGGKPNCYGEIIKVNLPNSRFVLSYSTEYYKLIDDDRIDALYPDIQAVISIDDYINGIDRAIETILNDEKDLNKA